MSVDDFRQARAQKHRLKKRLEELREEEDFDYLESLATEGFEDDE